MVVTRVVAAARVVVARAVAVSCYTHHDYTILRPDII